MKWNFISQLFISALVFSFSNNIYSQDANDVVATINGEKITVGQLENYYNRNLGVVRAFKKVSLQSSLDELINRQVGIDKAKKENIQSNPDVKEKINDVLYHAQISKDLAPKLLQIKVTDKEVKEFYTKYPEYNTSQILFRLPIHPSGAEVKEARLKASDAYALAKKNPKSFSDLAQKFSQSNDALSGGELGFQPRTRLTPEYYAAIKGQKIGHITEPFRTQYGVHVVKVLDIKPFDRINVDLYKKIIYDIKRDRILDNYFAALKKKAKINVNKDLLKKL